MGVSEERGGSGLGAIEEALIATALGRCLAAPSVLATIGATHACPESGGDSTVSGRRTAAAYLHGGRIILVEDSKAERMLLRADTETVLFERVFQSQPLEDYLWHSPLRECGPQAEPVARFATHGLLRLRLIDAAALCGIAEAAVGMAVAYAAVRKQFGRPIGGFQAIKHLCANMAVAARCARDQVNFAAVALDDSREDAAFQADCALIVAGNAALQNSGKNIQIHGGMGFSDEADPHLLLKRTQLLIALSGGLEAANCRIAEASAWRVK